MVPIQALQKGPEFGTWSQMGPKFQFGPKKVPILLTSPKFLTLPSDAAEKRRHTAVGHCCALFRHIQCIMCMYLILSGPLMRVSYLLTIRYILKWEMLRQRMFLSFLHVFCNFMKITTKSPKKSPKMVPKKSQFSPKGLNFAFVVLF